MTCPKCHRTDGHYLSCEMLDESHAGIKFAVVIWVLLVLFVVLTLMFLLEKPADATLQIDEPPYDYDFLYWQDGFNVPEHQETPQIARGGFDALARTDWGRTIEVWRPLVVAAFPASEVERAMCVLGGESSGNPDARNSSGASGLFQIMPFWAEAYGLPEAALFVPEANVNLAAALWSDEGWDEWSVWNKGLCR